ncbi:Hypothetical predicted protein [Olea europaea subsp. europaea]|uniref:Uncharacterized protein n=2 Tax=Olea europaea subsp. europaea TaxID=158383 RepID=A0A8S0R7E4_OLEEU|nr:Hypothetical predicted protein [Olea europaea subsp. europaea]
MEFQNLDLAKMGFTENIHQMNGISLRNPLKSISTNPVEKLGLQKDDEEEFSTTPKSADSRIPSILICPPAPKKRKASSKCHFAVVMEFFNPEDLETVFIPRGRKRLKRC